MTLDIDNHTPEQQPADERESPEELFTRAKKAGKGVPDEVLDNISAGEGWLFPNCPSCNSSDTVSHGLGFKCNNCGYTWS